MALSEEQIEMLLRLIAFDRELLESEWSVCTAETRAEKLHRLNNTASSLTLALAKARLKK